MTDYTITPDGHKYELKFGKRPSAATRRKLKGLGFTWSAARRAWYGEVTEDVKAFLTGKPSPMPEGARNRIILGDCVDILKTIPAASVDFVLTDPPYLVSYKDRSGRTLKNDDNSAWMKPAFAQIARVMKPDSLMLCFYGWQAVDHFMQAWKAAGLKPVDHMVAYKGYISSRRYFHRCHEQAFLLAKGNPLPPAKNDMLEDVRARWIYTQNAHHPTEKPVSNLKQFIQCFCPAGGLVLDPFAGSGSSCVAAQQAGRDYLGIEIDPAYHSVAAQRVAGGQP